MLIDQFNKINFVFYSRLKNELVEISINVYINIFCKIMNKYVEKKFYQSIENFLKLFSITIVNSHQYYNIFRRYLLAQKYAYTLINLNRAFAGYEKLEKVTITI